MTSLAQAWHRKALPKSAKAERFLEHYEPVSRPLIVAAAVLPLIVNVNRHEQLGVIVGVGSWLVFVADFVIQVRCRERYVASRLGMFDLAIVILTSPWYLLAGVHAGALVTLLRLARLARLVLVFRGAHRLLERLGRASLLAVLVVLVFSWVAFDAENPVNNQFASYGDSLWWGVVTLTTVGYGDIVPITVTGRYAGVVIMIMGVALLGVLAGSLASFFKLSPQQEQADEQKAESEQEYLKVPRSGNGATRAAHPDPGATPPTAAPSTTPPTAVPSPTAPAAVSVGDGPPAASSADAEGLAALTREVVDLRDQIESLTQHIKAMTDRPQN